jgi:predicted esterase
MRLVIVRTQRKDEPSRIRHVDGFGRCSSRDFIMSRDMFRLVLLIPAVIMLVGCPRNSAQPKTKVDPKQIAKVDPSAKLPDRPFKLAEPAALPDRIADKDLKKMDAPALLAAANQAMANSDYPNAAAYQYWFVQKAKTGQYNLACFLARIGQTDPALYYLQSAALEEGVDAGHAQRDEDLASVRRDRRWDAVQRFLVQCNRYFESANLARTVLILPQDYDIDDDLPIPAVVWMHGLGSRPDDFANGQAQQYADELNCAVIGVSGTRSKGPRSFVWAEEPEKDLKRVRDALEEVSDRVAIKKGEVVAFGFSQGGQVGLEIAVRHPEEFAGAIALSPGARSHLAEAKSSPLLAHRGFVVACGAEEHAGNVRLAADDADWLRRSNARVIHKSYPDTSAHAFPADFEERFPEWVRFVLKTREDSRKDSD